MSFGKGGSAAMTDSLRNEFNRVLSAAFESLESSPSEEHLLDDLQSLSRALEGARETSSSAVVPFAQLRDYIRQLLSSSPASSVVVLAGTILLRLISQVSLAYEELSFSICLHHIIRILRGAEGFKCGPKCDPKQTICSTSGDVALADYKTFWVKFVAVLRSKTISLDYPGFHSLCINAIVDVLRFGRGNWFHDLVLACIKATLDEKNPKGTVAIYKALLPVTRMALPVPNRTTLAAVLKYAAKWDQEQAASHSKPASTPTSRRISLELESVSSTPRGTFGSDSGDGNISERTALPVLRFFEISCIHVLDRAEQRASLCALVAKVLGSLDQGSRHSFGKFILRIARHPQGRIRIFAVEFASSLSILDEEISDMEWLTGSELIRMLSDRANDRLPTIRVKAIMALSEALRTASDQGMRHIQEELIDVAFSLIDRARDPKSRVRKATVDCVGIACQLLASHAGEAIGSSDSEAKPQRLQHQNELSFIERKALDLALLLKRRNHDTVSNVRLSIISQMTRVILGFSMLTTDELCGKLISLWCQVVLPHIDDVDARCKESCLRCTEAVFFSWGSQQKSKGTSVEHQWPVSSRSAGVLLPSFLCEIGSSNYAVAELGKRAVSSLCKKGSITLTDVRYFCEKAFPGTGSEDSMSRGSWLVLAEIASCGNAGLIKQAIGCTKVIEEAASRRNTSACKIAGKLLEFMAPKARNSFSVSLRESVFKERSSGNMKEWREYLSAAMDVMSLLQNENGNILLDQCQQRLSDAGGCLDDDEREKLLLLVGSICASFQLSREPPKGLVVFVVALASRSTTNSKLRAQALTTLGKICLCQRRGEIRNGILCSEVHGRGRSNDVNKLGESLTRRHISIFVHELENATSSATRNNAVIVLCDLCRQFTSVVEPYMARLAGLLSDPSEFIRLQVISSLVSLLQEDFVKLRTGAIFFQLARCLLDSNSQVRTTAEYAFLQVISPKSPSILATSFIELIYVLNECTESQTYNHNSLKLRGGKSQQSIANDGPQKLRIYDIFLEGMSLEQRLHLPSRFRSEVLSLICDGKLPLSSVPVQRILDDTLQLLTSDRILLAANRKGADDDGSLDQTENANTTNSQSIANVEKISGSKKLTLLSRVQLLELKESTIPTLLEIRHHLEEARSPLLQSVMKSLCVLLKPYMEDLETLVRDPVIRSEVCHEMEIMTKESRKAKRVRAPQKASDRAGKRPSSNVNQKDSQSIERWECRPSGSTPLSVPRTRPSHKRRNERPFNSDSEDGEFDFSEHRDNCSQKLSTRIAASPKLASIVTRARRRSSSQAIELNVDTNPSSFAVALARIEGDG